MQIREKGDSIQYSYKIAGGEGTLWATKIVFKMKKKKIIITSQLGLLKNAQPIIDSHSQKANFRLWKSVQCLDFWTLKFKLI
jgi:hypothetical protein